MRSVVCSLVLLLVVNVSQAQERFSELVGPLKEKAVKEKKPLEVPYITWGGDVAFFHANGGLITKKESIYGEMGLDLKFVNGDDFVGQVRRYVSGETPFLRGTYRMLGMASEVTGDSAETKPVVILQLTWSGGDHIVAREKIRTLNDLRPKDGKKVKIVLQQGGPHIGLLYDALRAAQLTNKDVELVFVTDLTGPNGPAEKFRKDDTIDACCVITPDMLGLTGGAESVGSGAEGTVKNSKVVVSTQQMSRSIADVLAVRKDWYDANKATVNKIVAGYLKSSVQVVEMRSKFESTARMTDDYKKLLEQAQAVFGKEVLPTLEVDAHGLLLDANFVGLVGNISFFEDSGNLNGFEAKMKAALDMATTWGYAKNRRGFDPSGLNYQEIAKLSGLKYEAPSTTKQRIKAESLKLFPDSEVDERTILYFTIHFQPNQQEFSADQYGAEFDRALETASTFGNAVIAIRGHSDPTKTLVDFIRAGMSKGIIRRTGDKGNYTYYFNGDKLDLKSTKQVAEAIKSGKFDGQTYSPRETMQAALNLSLSRAEAVKKALDEYSKLKKISLDTSQIQPIGVGIMEPVIAKPTNIEEAKKNMRVEFRIIRVPAESLKKEDFDF